MDNKPAVVKVPAIPVVVKKGSTLTLLKNNLPNKDLLMRCIKLSAVTKEQLIFKSVPGDFLRGEFPGLTLVSRLNVFNHSSTTVAKFSTKDGSGIIEKNSNEVIKVIGQNNYDTVFSALCSVISQELRIRALLALLTIEGSNKKKEVSAQTEKTFTNSACQTDETSKSLLDSFKQRKRVKRQQFRPYIVKEDNRKLRRVVIDPKHPLPKLTNSTLASEDNEESNNSADVSKCIPKSEISVTDSESFPDLSGIVNEDSNFSDISIGNISLTSQHSVNIPRQVLENPNSLLDNIDHHTENLNIVPLTLLDQSVIMVCAKPIDKFHWATPDILKNLSKVDQNKLLYHQAFIHWKYCLERDEDGYLPIHHAVMSNDIDFLVRQCSALKKKYGSVDVPATGNMTALQLSIHKDGERCTAILLENGADPCLQDDEEKNFFHTAAEVSQEHLQIALDHCRRHARTMLKEDDDLWNPVMEHQSDEQLAKILLDHICIMCDNQGYTPLMLASKQGNYANVELLLKASPETVNRPTPNSGSTALYLAVEAACIEASNSKNQSKVSENFLKTIEILMEGGGDPNLENHFGSSVNILLTEFNIVDLSVLIANKLTAVRYFDGNNFAVNNISSLMLFKNSDGKVDLTEIRSRRANDETQDAAAGTGDVTIPTINKNVDSKVSKEKRTSTAKVDKGKKTSNVKIKDIKTIKGKKTGGEVSAAPPPTLVPNAGNVIPSHFIIVPKNPATSSHVPKFVKILPKLDTRKDAGGAVKRVSATDVTGRPHVDSIDKKIQIRRKKLTDTGATPGKKQRKDTQQS